MRPAAAPAPTLAAEQREHEREEAAGQQHEARRVEATVALVARLVQVGDRTEHAADPDREVDEEDPAPAGPLRQCAADERADRDRRADRRAPDPERGPALAPVKLLREDGERDREHRRAAHALEAAGEVQEEGRGGRPAEGRGKREDADPRDEDPLAAEQVADRARAQGRACEQEGVGVDHPLEVGQGGMEVTLDARQRDIDDRDVEEQHEDGDANDDEGPPLALHSVETT